MSKKMPNKTRYSVTITDYNKEYDSYKFLLIDNYTPSETTRQYELPCMLLSNIVGLKGWAIDLPEKDIGKTFKKTYAINPLASPKKKDGKWVLEEYYG